MADHKLIGKNYTTPDLVAKVTGKAKYAEDYRAEGMLFCKLLLSPRPHARVTRIDASAALAMPGVLRRPHRGRHAGAAAAARSACRASSAGGPGGRRDAARWCARCWCIGAGGRGTSGRSGCRSCSRHAASGRASQSAR